MSETTWDEARRKLIRSTICPKGISEDEFALFMAQCVRADLDPLLKEAFCVPRKVNTGSKEKPNWVTKHEFQPAEAGMLKRAKTFPDYEGISAAEVYAEDPITIDYGRGLVEHKVNPAQRKGVLVGAWARVQLKGRVPVVVWVDFAAAVQSTPLWTRMPARMVRKVARVDALRTAYPEAFGGQYVAGERPDDVDNGEDSADATPPAMEKPALPPPAPRETLETSPAKEPAPVRERATEEAQTEEVDEMEAALLQLEKDAANASTEAEVKALKPRAQAFPRGSEEAKRAAKAVNAAWARVREGGAA